DAASWGERRDVSRRRSHGVFAKGMAVGCGSGTQRSASRPDPRNDCTPRRADLSLVCPVRGETRECLPNRYPGEWYGYGVTGMSLVGFRGATGESTSVPGQRRAPGKWPRRTGGGSGGGSRSGPHRTGADCRHRRGGGDWQP
ncbi:MAG TPA: hypothetical protein DCE55_11970, partial [Planctomycetaceae bacterium]|nr:hypothetical protein [Planctomycetaceae bacterium]